MAQTLIVAGFGPGISTAVADRFGKAGFQIALVARNSERLAAGVKDLTRKGITAKAYVADLSNPAQAAWVVGEVRNELGAVTSLHWNAFSGGAGDLLNSDPSAIRSALDLSTTSLITAVKEALPDLKLARGSVLVTNGGLAYFDPLMDAVAVQFGSMGLAMANAAKHKLVGLLHERLKKDGVFVGEVTVEGLVKGTASDRGNATLAPAAIAEKFWELNQARDQVFVRVN
jgi:NADP-dependent 3-hydroxy acid dehydrogenase YdfG